MKVNIPYMTCDEISDWVKSVRDFDDGDPSLFRPPVDIVEIVEIVYSLDIVPVPDLLKKHKCDAILMCDFTGFYMDKEEYDSLDSREKKNNRRLRMSMAHELGHLILHKDSVEPYIETLTTVEQYEEMALDHLLSSGRAEWQAWEFAGRLMVPEDDLKKIYHELYDRTIKGHDLTNPVDNEHTRNELCRKIGYRFDVNQGVISKRLDIHGLWPIE